MFRRLFALLFALSLAFSVAAAEELTTYQTEHFSFSAPSDWLVSRNGDDFIFTPDNSKSSSGNGLLFFHETAFDLGDFPVDEAYDELSSGLLADGTYSLLHSSDVTVSGSTARSLSVNVSTTGPDAYACLILYVTNGYLCCLSYCNPSLPDSSVDDYALSLSQYITCKDLYNISHDVFSENLISAKLVDSTGYIFVDVDLHGSNASSMISNLEDEATDFLAALRDLVDSGAIDFTEVSFKGYTDLIDVYGNTSHDYVIQFWITRDTLYKINFDHFIYTNMEAIATNWYLHPAMSK